MQEYYFNLRAPYVKCEILYTAGINVVVITADSGVRVQLPTKNLRPFVDSNGINGRFRLIIDQQNKVKSFKKIG